MTFNGLIQGKVVMPALDPGIHVREPMSGASGITPTRADFEVFRGLPGQARQ
jgi:hypothetical protein